MHGWVSWLQETFPASSGWREIWTLTGLCWCFLPNTGHSFAHLSDWWLMKIMLKYSIIHLNCFIVQLQHIFIFCVHKSWHLLCQLNPFHISNRISLWSVLISMTFILNIAILNFLRHNWVGNILPLHLVIESNSYMKLSTGSLQFKTGFFPEGTVTKKIPAHRDNCTFYFTDHTHLSVSMSTDGDLLEDKLF